MSSFDEKEMCIIKREMEIEIKIAKQLRGSFRQLWLVLYNFLILKQLCEMDPRLCVHIWHEEGKEGSENIKEIYHLFSH